MALTLVNEMAHNKITHQKIWQFVWPVLLGNLSIPLLGLVDTALLGHLSDAIYLGAVAVGSSVVTMLLWVFGFFKMGVTSLVAQAKGRNEKTVPLTLGIQALVAAVMLGCLIVLIAPLALPHLFAGLSSDPSVIGLAQTHAKVRLLAAPVVLGSYVITGWLLAQQQTKSVLWLLLLLNLSNIGLDYVFIWRLELASDGAAWATLLAEVVTFMAGIFLVWRGLSKEQRCLLSQYRLHQLVTRSAETLTLFKVNSALFLRTLCLLGVLLWFWRLSASLGESTLAVNALLMQLVGLSAFVLDAFAHCAEALIGESVGMRNRQRFLQVLLKTLMWLTVTTLLLSSLFYLFGEALLGALSDIPSVMALSQQYLIWIVLLPLVSSLAYHFDGVCLGMGSIRPMLMSVVIGAFMGFLPIWYGREGGDNHQLWLALLGFNGLRSLSLSLYVFYKILKQQPAWFDEQTEA